MSLDLLGNKMSGLTIHSIHIYIERGQVRDRQVLFISLDVAHYNRYYCNYINKWLLDIVQCILSFES